MSSCSGGVVGGGGSLLLSSTTSSSGEDTYLESFVESVSILLPNEVRRNLELMKELDKSCSGIVNKLRILEEDYVLRAKDILGDLQVQRRSQFNQQQLETNKRQKLNQSEPDKEEKPEGSPPIEQTTTPATDNHNVDNHTNDSNEKDELGIVVKSEEDGGEVFVIPTTEELREMIEDTHVLADMAKLRRDAKQQSYEKVAIAQQTYALVEAACNRLDSDLQRFESELKGMGAFETTAGAKPDDLAAIQVTPNSPDWILAKVISHDPKTGMYMLSDEDVESNKTFHLPEAQVVILGGLEGSNRLARGDIIYAVYPDTTSFYQATVVQTVPSAVNKKNESFVMVNFKDDGDEHGITHDKAVPMQHVMRVPYGAIQ